MFSIKTLQSWLKTTAIISATSLSFGANAGLMGDSVEGALSTGNQTITTQFSSPAIVDAGVEFEGVMTDVFNQVWSISVDIADTSFSVSITESTRNGDGNVSSGNDLLMISLWDLVAVDEVILTDYTCSSTGSSCDWGGNNSHLATLDYTPTSLSLGFNALYDGETYTFSTLSQADVPAPLTIGLMLIGLAGVRAARGRK
ncbi:hypothetical protein DU002_02985 [Corallincola holothuriorum]|uniref:PEP-CTERM protein-sorting domain-containing protein n=1 Tax=Corallincola holothuriorum TaxID=2282215 RepID=A0A368NMT1_9GAMM|nr:hypothetical protein [Corallincola holothuriorum]RCU51456.1 hypothetical protein DU002_02985 [Corallincola holothuriorum]